MSKTVFVYRPELNLARFPAFYEFSATLPIGGGATQIILRRQAGAVDVR